MAMKPPSVATIADDAEIDHAIATLVLAFGADPVARWMYGDPHQYLLHIPRLFRALGTSSFAAGAAQRTNDGLGIAIWLPSHPVFTAMMGRLRRSLQIVSLGKSKPKSPLSSRGRNIIGPPIPIGICR